MKYNVTYTIEEDYEMVIEANSMQEAMSKAKDKYLSADFKTKQVHNLNKIMFLIKTDSGIWQL